MGRNGVISRVLTAALAVALWCCPAGAQDWPARTVTIIVPFIAGSTPDSLARIVAERLQARLGQPFVVENRPGASGNTGTAAVAKATPDGHTLGVSIVGPLVINHLLFAKMPYETARDIAPITILASQPSVLVTTPSAGANNVKDLLGMMERDPDNFTYGSIGRGSLSHLAMEALAAKAGAKVVHLPFPGSPAAVTALLRGDVQMAVLPAASVVPQGREGKLRLLAVTSPQRSALLPDLPTLREAAIAGVEADAWVGLIAPSATPGPVLAKIHKEAVAVLAEPQVVDKLKPQFMVPVANTPDQFRAVLKEEHDRWAPIIEDRGIKAE
jgi:tripartite-type tricarboxylate transporter receptor subunit TctC